MCCARQRRGEVELLHLGRLDGQCRFRVLLLARHHVLRNHGKLWAGRDLSRSWPIPTRGDGFDSRLNSWSSLSWTRTGSRRATRQGSSAADHNEDYVGESSHAPSARCATRFLWSQGWLRLALDMHCPSIRALARADLLCLPPRKRLARSAALLRDLEGRSDRSPPGSTSTRRTATRSGAPHLTRLGEVCRVGRTASGRAPRHDH